MTAVPVDGPPMTVALVIRSLDDGGAQRQLTNLAVGLHRRGDRVVVLSHFPGGRFADELRAAGVEVDHLDRGPRTDPRYVLRLLRRLRAESPDVVACYLVDSNVLGLLSRVTSPRAAVVLGIRSDSPNRHAGTRIGRALPTVERHLARLADAIVVNSRRGERYLLDHGYPADRVHEVDNGIDLGLFRPDPAKRATTREAWGVAAGERLVGFVGRGHPQKGIPVLLEAARRVADRDPSVRFVLIGKTVDRGYADELSTLAGSLGLTAPRLAWLPSHPDMPAAYNAFDVLVNSSFSEGLANCIAESLACGTPCVVTDVGDSAALVGDPRRVVPPGEPGPLAEAVLAALDERSDGEEVRAAVSGYDLDTMVERTRDVYVGVLDRRTGRRPARG